MENIKKSTPFYMVYAEGKSSPTYKHTDLATAQNEAKRLTRELGVRCYVLSSLCYTNNVKIKLHRPEKVYWFKWVSEEQSQALMDKLKDIAKPEDLPCYMPDRDPKPGDIVFNIGRRILVKSDNDTSVAIVAKMVGYELEIEDDNLPF